MKVNIRSCICNSFQSVIVEKVGWRLTSSLLCSKAPYFNNHQVFLYWCISGHGRRKWSCLHQFFFINLTIKLRKLTFLALCLSPAVKTSTLLNLSLDIWITPDHECFPLLSLDMYQCHFVTSQRGAHPKSDEFRAIEISNFSAFCGKQFSFICWVVGLFCLIWQHLFPLLKLLKASRRKHWKRDTISPQPVVFMQRLKKTPQ